MDCNGNIYNIGMGCCEPMLGPIENYYTKPATDRRIQEEISGISAVTIDEVQEMIDEAVSGITVSGVTEEQMNEAIASAKTQIEAEIPTVPTKVSAFENDVPYLTEHQSLSGYATEQWVEDKHYITGVDLSDYALKSEIPVVPTSNTAFTNDAGYLTEHQSLSGYATEAFVSAFTYDKATIDEKVAGGGSFDPSQYYNKTATDELLAEKLDVTAYTPVDLSNYYTTGETVNLVESAVTRVEGEIPTVPTSNTAFTNDAGYLTEHQSLSGYATEQWVEDKHYITGVDLSNYATTSDVNNVSTALTSHASNTTIHVTPEQVSNWNAKSDFSGSYNDLTDKPTIPTVPTDISAFNNDVGYITGVDLSNYATKDNLTAATDDMATKTWVGQQGYLTEHQSLTAYSTTEQVNSAITQAVSGKQDTLVSSVNIKTINNESLLGSGNITIQGGGTDAPISAGTGTEAIVENFTGNTASGNYSNAEGYMTSASGYASHAEGFYTETKNYGEHASGMYNVSHTGSYTKDQTLFSVGNGDKKTRRNAFEIRQNGDIYIRKNNTDVRLQDITPGIWCGTMAEYQEISGSTDNNTIYLIHS